MSNKSAFSRRDFVRSGALVAAVSLAPRNMLALGQQRPPDAEPSPISLGLASYTFRNFTRAQLIGFILAICIPSFTALTGVLLSNAAFQTSTDALRICAATWMPASRI